jgi:hypothetical protein
MGFQLSTFLEEFLFGEHSTMKVVSCVWGGELFSIIGLYGRISQGGLRDGGLPYGRC